MNKTEFLKAVEALEPKALEALERALREGGSNAVKAAEMLLAYTQGKPESSVKHDVAGLVVNIVRFSDDKIIEHQPLKTIN